MANNKILLLAYYWPPSASVAMHRWYFMSKHLADLGYQVHVITAKNADYSSTDKQVPEIPMHKGIGQIILRRFAIWEIRKVFSFFIKSNAKQTDGFFYKDKKQMSFKEKLSLWIRANFFVPDARVPWYFQIRSKVHTYMKANDIATLITTGTPHSLHLTGCYLKKRMEIKWIADFRDPWTSIEYYKNLPISKIAHTLNKRLESKVLSLADQVVTVSPSWAKEFNSLSSKECAVIFNGYEEARFADLKKTRSEKYSITHLGTLRSDRNPETLWQQLSLLKDEYDFQLDLYGEVSPDVIDSISSYNLMSKVNVHGTVSHEKALKAMLDSDLLLLLINKNADNELGRIPAKLFEYLRTQSHILLLGNQEGDSERIVTSFQNTSSLKYQDEKGIQQALITLFTRKSSQRRTGIETYSRKTQATNVAAILEKPTVLD